MACPLLYKCVHKFVSPNVETRERKSRSCRDLMCTSLYRQSIPYIRIEKFTPGVSPFFLCF